MLDHRYFICGRCSYYKHGRSACGAKYEHFPPYSSIGVTVWYDKPACALFRGRVLEYHTSYTTKGSVKYVNVGY